MKKTNRNIFYMISSDIVSTFGSTVFFLAMMWVVYDKTQSAFGTAVVGVLGHIATLIASPIAGVFVDSHKPLKVLRNSLITSGILLLALFLLSTTLPSSFQVAGIYLFVFLLFISYSFTNPAETKVIPNLVHSHEIGKLYGYRSTSTQISELIGSSAAGYIIIWGGFGGSVLINMVAFLISAFVVTRLSLVKPFDEVPTSDTIEKEPLNLRLKLVEGFKVIKENKKIFKVAQLSILLNIASMLGPLWIVIVSVQFDGGAKEYGFLQACGLVGGAIAGIITGKFQQYVNAGLTMSIGIIANGLLIIIISLVGNIYFAYVLFAFILFSRTSYSVLLSTILATTIPEAFRGRVSGLIQSVGVILVPLATLAGGAISDWLGVSIVFLASGIWTFSIGLYALSIKEMRQISTKPSNVEARV